MRKRFCGNCGLELPAGAVFCPRCGAKSAIPPESDGSAPAGAGQVAAPAGGALAQGPGSAAPAPAAPTQQPAPAAPAAPASQPAAPTPQPTAAPTQQPAPAPQPAPPAQQPAPAAPAPEAHRRTQLLSEADAPMGVDYSAPSERPDEPAPKPEQAPAQELPKLPDFDRARAKKVGVVAASVVAVLFLVFVAVSWLGDHKLSSQAREAETQSGFVAAQSSVSSQGEPSTTTGLGGGAVVADAGFVFWGDTSGVWALAEGDALANASRGNGDGLAAATKLCGDAVTCVNAYNGSLYYLEGTSGSGASTVRVLRDATSNAGTSGQSSETLVTADAGASLGNLIVRNGVAFYTSTDASGNMSVRALALDQDQAAPVQLGSPVAARVASLSYSEASGTLAWVAGSDAGWTLRTAPCRDASALGGVAFSDVMSGSGSISAVAYDGSTVFVSATGEDGRAKTAAYQPSGNFKEYAELSGASTLCASSSDVLVLTGSGSLAYIDSEAGFSHDMSQAATSLVDASALAGAKLSVQGSTAYVVTTAGDVLAFDLSTDPPAAGFAARQS